MTFQVFVRVGPGDAGDPASHAWTFTEDPAGGPVADGLTVLEGLSFGWSMPGPLWPVQPDPMVATLALNVPDFVLGLFTDPKVPVARLVIEVKADSAGPVVARFYGDVTDFKATTRQGRPGVTVSVVAVDPVVRLRDRYKAQPLPDPGVPVSDASVISQLWADDLTGLGAGGGVVAWPVPGRVVNAAGLPYGELFQPVDLIAQLLTQAVDVPNTRRMILAPMIDGPTGKLLAGGSSPSHRIYTLDVVAADMGPGTLVWSPPADAVRMDTVTWATSKDNRIFEVVATGYAGVGTNEVSNTYDHPAPNPVGSVSVRVPVTLQEETDAVAVASFYYDHSRIETWTLDRVDVEVTKATRAGTPVPVPVGLFPDWTLAEDAPGRTTCYSALVRISGVDTTRTPDAADVILGRLVGVSCVIAGGALTLSLALRRPLEVASDPLGRNGMMVPGFGLGAYGRLAA